MFIQPTRFQGLPIFWQSNAIPTARVHFRGDDAPQDEFTADLTAAIAGNSSASQATTALSPKVKAQRKMENDIRRATDLLAWWGDKQYLRNVPLDKTEFTVLDIETTGLRRSDRNQEIIEIGAIKYRDGVEVSRFSTLVKPKNPVPEKITQLTGITQEMADKGMKPQQALESFAQFVGPYATLVAHNASYDLPFIRSKLHQNDLDHWMSNFDLKRAICTQTLARVALPQIEGYPQRGKGLYKAETLAKYFGFPNPGAHRAVNDVETTAKTLYELIRRLQANTNVTGNDMKGLKDLYAYQGPAVSMAANPISLDNVSDPTVLVAKAKDILGKLKFPPF